MGIEKNPAFWIWLVFFLLILVFLIIMIILLTTGYTTPKESEQIYTFDSLTTNRHENATVNVKAKIRLKGGIKESEIPTREEYRAFIVTTLDNLVAYDATTHWNILCQAIGKEFVLKPSVVASSILLQTGTPEVEQYVYTEGFIHPLDA